MQDSSSLSSAQIAQLANNYKLTPATLMAECCDWWLPMPFLQYMASEIASAIARGNCGLLISAPPRHGKSKLITVATPLWVIENFPGKNVIVATYGEDLSTDFTREVKDIIKANPTKLSVRIRRDVDRAQNFVTPQGGGIKAVGLRGTITGRGAHVLIIDDYIKEPKEALNHNYLESLKTWYATVARTRLEPGAVVIIVATRWVTNDLHGHIERLEARKPIGRRFYKNIKIPAISGKLNKDTNTWEAGPTPDLLGRQPGQALFPGRYDINQLEDIRLEVGNRWFEAMFQQNPASEDTAITNPENLRYISRADFNTMLAQAAAKGAPYYNSRFKWGRAWDFASTKDAGDFTAGPLGVWDKINDRLFIDSLVHGQFSAGKAENVFAGKHSTDDPRVKYVIEQEPGSAGAYAFKHFAELCPGRSCSAAKATADGSKLLKAQPFLAATEAHKIYLVVDDLDDIEATTWIAKFVDEFTVFPEGGYDDIMDATSSLYNMLTGRKAMAGAWGRSTEAKSAIDRLQQNGGAIDGSKTGGQITRSRTTFGRSTSDMAKKGRGLIFSSRR